MGVGWKMRFAVVLHKDTERDGSVNSIPAGSEMSISLLMLCIPEQGLQMEWHVRIEISLPAV